MCDPRRIARRLDNFGRALRTVDGDPLRHFLAPGRFRGMSVRRSPPATAGGSREIDVVSPENTLFWANGYGTALRRLERRGGLRIRFDRVESAGNGEGGGAFTGVFRANNGRKLELWGKVGMSCKEPAIIQIGIAVGPRSLYEHRPCPKPRRRPKGAIVACSLRF